MKRRRVATGDGIVSWFFLWKNSPTECKDRHMRAVYGSCRT